MFVTKESTPSNRATTSARTRRNANVALSRWIALCFLTFPLLSTNVYAQPQQTRIPYSRGCATCSIELVKVAELGGALHGKSLSDLTKIERDSRGRYYATGLDPARIVVFDSTGKLITTFGGVGSGPGEFRRMIQYMRIGANDSLYVFDASTSVSVFSPSHVFVRSFRTVGTRQTAELLSDGSVVLGASVPQPANAGFPFHVLARDGAIARSFGTKWPVIPGQPPPTHFMLFRLSPDTRTLWHWTMFEYRFEQWSVEGQLLKTVEVTNVPWLPALKQATPARAPGSPTSIHNPGPARLHFLGVDNEQRLWSLGLDSGTHLLQVIDVQRGVIIASRTIPMQIRLLNRDNLAYSTVTSDAGVVTVTVWRLEVRG